MKAQPFRKIKRHQQAFTLIEMITVIVMLAIISSTVVPAYLRYLTRAEFDKGVQQVRGLLVWAKSEAAKSSHDATVTFDQQSNTITLETQAPDMGTSGPTAISDSSNANPTQNLHAPVELSDKMTIAEFTITDPNLQNQNLGHNQLRFHDDGSCDGATLRLIGPSGDSITLEIAAQTSVITQKSENNGNYKP